MGVPRPHPSTHLWPRDLQTSRCVLLRERETCGNMGKLGGRTGLLRASSAIISRRSDAHRDSDSAISASRQPIS